MLFGVAGNMAYSLEQCEKIEDEEDINDSQSTQILGIVPLSRNGGSGDKQFEKNLIFKAHMKLKFRRASSFSPSSSDNWLSWMQHVFLRRTSSVDDTSYDNDSTFTVYLEQKSPQKESQIFKVFSSHFHDESALALDSLKRTLQPFADSSLPFDLLELLVLPQPKTLSELPPIIISYLQNEVERETEWVSLANLQISKLSLAYHACVLGEVDVLNLLIEKGADIMFEDQSTGNSLIHISAKYSHHCLVSVLDVLRNTLSLSDFHNFLNKPNHNSFDSQKIKQPHEMQTIMMGLAQVIVPSMAPHNISPLPRRKNQPGVTPLMLACAEENITSMGVLLSEGADPNACDPSRGTTPLHIAVTLGNISLIQILLSFGADLDAKNEDGDRPQDLLKKNPNKNSTKCEQILEKIRYLRKRSEKVQGHVEAPKKTKRGMFLLSLDGGGTRSIIPAYMLHFIEQRMKYISKKSDINISNYFNWLAGTSAGSNMTLGMIYNQCTPAKTMRIIVSERDKLFSGKRLYAEENLDEFIKRFVGEDKYIDSVREPRVIVPTTLADRTPPDLALITNYRDNPDNNRKWKVWEAVRASAAAPTYFPAFEKKYYDGGIMAANPTLVAMTEALNNSTESLSLVLSLGTGVIPSESVDTVDVVYPRWSSFVSDIKQDLRFMPQLIDLLTANLQNHKQSVLQAECWCRSMGTKYQRFSPPVSSNHDLDTKDDTALAELIFDVYVYCLENAQEIENISCLLLSHGPQHNTHLRN